MWTEKELCQDFIQKENKQPLCRVRSTNLTLGHCQDELWSPWRVCVCTSFGSSAGSALHSCCTGKSCCLSAARAEQCEAGKAQEEQSLCSPALHGAGWTMCPCCFPRAPPLPACAIPCCSSGAPGSPTKVSPAGPVSLNAIPSAAPPVCSSRCPACHAHKCWCCQ